MGSDRTNPGGAAGAIDRAGAGAAASAARVVMDPLAEVGTAGLLWAAVLGGVVAGGSIVAATMLAARLSPVRPVLPNGPRPRTYGFDDVRPTPSDPVRPSEAKAAGPPGPPVEPAATSARGTSPTPPEPARRTEPVTSAEPARRTEPVTPTEPTRIEPPTPGGGTLRGILRWLASQTDADAVALLRMGPRTQERLLIEPRGLPAGSVLDLSRRVHDALLTAPTADQEGEVMLAGGAASRWLGTGGVKALLVTGVRASEAAEPLRFARSVVEWLAASDADQGLSPAEASVLAVRGVAWAESTEAGGIRLMGATGAAAETLRAARAAMAGRDVEWIDRPGAGAFGAPVVPIEPRVELIDVSVLEEDQARSAEVRLVWQGSELRGLGRAEEHVAGPYLAAARAAVDALSPLLHGDITLEHLHVLTFPPDLQVIVVAVLLADERLVGAALLQPEEGGERAAAKAILHAANRRLAMLAGRGGPL